MRRLLTLTDPPIVTPVRRGKTEKNVRLRGTAPTASCSKPTAAPTARHPPILYTSECTVNDWLDRYDVGWLEALCA